MLLKVSSTDDGQWDLPSDEPISPPDIDGIRSGQFDPSSPTKDSSLFSLYLRSRSPSCLSTNGPGDNNDGRIHSQSVSSSDTRLSIVGASCQADLPDHNAVSPKAAPKSKKPRITLRVRPLESKSKPKISLRLRQPKSGVRIRSSIFRK